MLRNSLIAAAVAFATVTSSAVPGNAGTADVNGRPHHRTVVHHVCTPEPAPSLYYYDTYYGPSYGPAFASAADHRSTWRGSLPSLSLIGAC